MCAHSTTIVMATRNEGKLREFRRLLQSGGWEVLGLDQIPDAADPEETGVTFAENARIKAEAYSSQTRWPVLADDSGLEVFAIGGRPGVHSARYAGSGAGDEERVRKLLEELRDPSLARDARFVCALALAQRGRIEMEVEGECRGVIAPEPRGNNGFGYDPVFLMPDLERTFAELPGQQKDRFSHRARAVEALLRAVEAMRRERPGWPSG
jgi:XTP/dITP diphosphohydrolase